MKRKYTYFLYAIIFATTVVLSACEANPSSTNEVELNTAFQDFSTVVSASGIVTPQQWAILSLPAGGTIKNLMVAENEQVVEGQVLLQLGGAARLEASIKATYLEVISAQQAYNDLFEYQETSRALIEQSVAILRDTVRDTETRINNLNYSASQEYIDASFASLVLAEDQLDKATDYFEKFEAKPETNLQRANAVIALNRAQNAYDRALSSYNYAIGSADEFEVGKAEANLALAKTQLADAEWNLEQIADGPDPDTIALVEARLENANAQENAAQAALDDLQLKAPFSGTIGQIIVRQYEWVSPGQPLIVMGDISALQIETTDLNEVDVARITLGSTATVAFDALPDQIIKAVVIQIAIKSSPGAGVNYTVILQLIDVPKGLLWDMTAFVDIQEKE